MVSIGCTLATARDSYEGHVWLFTIYMFIDRGTMPGTVRSTIGQIDALSSLSQLTQSEEKTHEKKTPSQKT